MVTVSLALYPAPVTVTLVVGAPTLGFSVMLVVTAAAGDVDSASARTKLPAARAPSERRHRDAESIRLRRVTMPARAGRSRRTVSVPIGHPPQAGCRRDRRGACEQEGYHGVRCVCIGSTRL